MIGRTPLRPGLFIFGCRGTEHGGNRPCRLWLRSVPVLTDECRQRCSDLRLSHRRSERALAERRGIRPDDGDPNILRALLFNAVFLPLHRTAAPAVVGGNDEGGGPAVA